MKISINTAKSATERLVFLEERVIYLEDANRKYVALLEMLASSSDFQANLNRDRSSRGIFKATLLHLKNLFPFENMGLLEIRVDNSFVLTEYEPESCQNELSMEIERAIKNGTFAWALNRNQGAISSDASGSPRFLFHVIATQSRIRGMFIGRLPANPANFDAPSLNVLSNILLASAYAMESSTLYGLLQGNLQTLEEKVQERTSELLAARDIAEAKSRELKATNEQLCKEISDRKRAEEELLKAQKLESLGLFVGGLAHDFNNILTAILGNLSFVRMQLNPYDKIAKRLEECEKATARASELTRQFLTFAKGGEPLKKLINPAIFIKEASSLVLRGSNVSSLIDLEEELWCVEADGGQLSQVLNNLLINARQSMSEGGVVTIRGTNETLPADNLKQLLPGNYIRIVISDHGCGIPAENLVKIFDPYFTTKSQGSGLGLASVYSIVNKHGGAIDVTSTIGKGSNFTIFLPACPEKQPEVTVVNENTEIVGEGRVLIMDDEDSIRDIATEILQYLGYYVVSCSDGREAIELYRNAQENHVPFSVVILDLTVPRGMGGKEAAAQILEIDSDAVLIVSSGYSNDPVIANYFYFGFSGVICKPFDVGTLSGELARLNDKKSYRISNLHMVG